MTKKPCLALAELLAKKIRGEQFNEKRQTELLSIFQCFYRNCVLSGNKRDCLRHDAAQVPPQRQFSTAPLQEARRRMFHIVAGLFPPQQLRARASLSRIEKKGRGAAAREPGPAGPGEAPDLGVTSSAPGAAASVASRRLSCFRFSDFFFFLFELDSLGETHPNILCLVLSLFFLFSFFLRANEP